MFLIFLALSLLSRLCCTERMLDIGLLLVSSIYFHSFGVPVIREFWDSPLGGILCEYEVTRYFQFFALGIFCRKYWNQFARLLTKDWFKTLFIVIFVACLCFMNLIEKSQTFPPTPNSVKIIGILVRYAGLIVVVSFFFSRERYFNEGNISGNLLEYIGRRTLDIYLLHFFFLPDLKYLQPIFYHRRYGHHSTVYRHHRISSHHHPLSIDKQCTSFQQLSRVLAIWRQTARLQSEEIHGAPCLTAPWMVLENRKDFAPSCASFPIYRRTGRSTPMNMGKSCTRTKTTCPAKAPSGSSNT